MVCIQQKGFTLLELMLVVAMIGLIAAFSITVGTGFLWRTDLSQAQYTTVVSLRYAQLLSQAGEENADWGVHIEDNELTIFNGSVFESRDVTKDEEYDLGRVTISPAMDIIYEKFSGKPYEDSSEIQLVTDQDTASITINSEGNVEY